MAARTIPRLEAFFQERVGDDLRSIIRYGETDFEIVYLRDDVDDQYTSTEVAQSVDDSRMDSLSAPLYTDSFAEDHGDLTCLVQCFEHVIELNFVLEGGVGVAVALDAEAMAEGHGLIAEAREIATQGHQ